jgi:starch synthase (maltosyl-transferring)
MDRHQRERVVIEHVQPSIDCGRFAVKRVVGQQVTVEADIFADGHDELTCFVLFRRAGARSWQTSPMTPLGNDLWRGSFAVEETGEYEYTVSARVDAFKTWQRTLKKRLKSNLDVTADLLAGTQLLEEAGGRACGPDRDSLLEHAQRIRNANTAGETDEAATGSAVAALASRYGDRDGATTHAPALRVSVDRERALFGAWYEMFPRSCSPVPGRHGAFADCEARLPYIARLGFDVLYLPPIHPIGVTARKGRNNSETCLQGDPGTPWAIGSSEGGHKAVHPSLGTLDDFHSLVRRAGDLGIEIAMDIAFQCSPDHPYVQEHPQWFRRRPDGTVQYAENPPKQYQDLYPLEFQNDDRQHLWEELRGIVRFWMDQGVRIFRVDNPHTKPFEFWEWLISSLKSEYPDLIFLAEAFTRPKVMHRLAKLGFTQSYTYFTWRRTKWELTEYLTELTHGEVAEYFRPNFWPNTPDILMDYLQTGGRPAFEARLVLAATLSSSYGIYGPAFELCVNTPLAEGSEEYLDSEKYELKHWDIDSPDSIAELIARVNHIRRDSKALQQANNLCFDHVDNDMLLAYTKWDATGSDRLLVVVNMDPKHAQGGWLTQAPETSFHHAGGPYIVRDLLNGREYSWSGTRNYVLLDPSEAVAHIFRMPADAGAAQEVSNAPGGDA